MINAVSKVPMRCCDVSEDIDLLEIGGDALGRPWRRKAAFISDHYASGTHFSRGLTCIAK